MGDRIHSAPMYKPRYFVTSLEALFAQCSASGQTPPPEEIEEILELHGLHKLVSIRNSVLRAKEKARHRARELQETLTALRAQYRDHPVCQRYGALRQQERELARRLRDPLLDPVTELKLRREIARCREERIRAWRDPEWNRLREEIRAVQAEREINHRLLAWLRSLLKQPRRVRDLAGAGTGVLTPSARADMEGDRRTLSEVVPGLFLSDDRLDRYIKPLGIGAVLALTAEDEDSGVDQIIRWRGGRCVYHSVPLRDHQPVPEELLDHMVRWIDRHLSDGTRVAVHCQAGMSRTPAVAVAYFCHRGMTFDDALRTIRERHPITNPSRIVLESVRRWAEKRSGAFGVAG